MAISIRLPMNLLAVDKAWSTAPRMRIWLSSNRWMLPVSRTKCQSARTFSAHPPAAHATAHPRFLPLAILRDEPGYVMRLLNDMKPFAVFDLDGRSKKKLEDEKQALPQMAGEDP